MSSSGLKRLGLFSNAVRVSSDGSRLTVRPSWEPSVLKHLEQIVEGQAVGPPVYDLLEQTKALNSKNEYKQWLHVWTMRTGNSNDAGHVSKHFSYPWVPIWEKPELDLMMAHYHITDWTNLPTMWGTFWYDLNECIEDARIARTGGSGPYWMLRTTPAIYQLAGEMASMKRRIANEVLQCLRPTVGDKEILTYQRSMFIDALVPFRVMSFEQEQEDEAIRTAEKRRNVVQVRNSPPSGRPPRCR